MNEEQRKLGEEYARRLVKRAESVKNASSKERIRPDLLMTIPCQLGSHTD